MFAFQANSKGPTKSSCYEKVLPLLIYRMLLPHGDRAYDSPDHLTTWWSLASDDTFAVFDESVIMPVIMV